MCVFLKSLVIATLFPQVLIWSLEAKQMLERESFYSVLCSLCLSILDLHSISVLTLVCLSSYQETPSWSETQAALWSFERLHAGLHSHSSKGRPSCTWANEQRWNEFQDEFQACGESSRDNIHQVASSKLPPPSHAFIGNKQKSDRPPSCGTAMREWIKLMHIPSTVTQR